MSIVFEKLGMYERLFFICTDARAEIQLLVLYCSLQVPYQTPRFQ